jgi:hypothetical protein
MAVALADLRQPCPHGLGRHCAELGRCEHRPRDDGFGKPAAAARPGRSGVADVEGADQRGLIGIRGRAAGAGMAQQGHGHLGPAQLIDDHQIGDLIAAGRRFVIEKRGDEHQVHSRFPLPGASEHARQSISRCRSCSKSGQYGRLRLARRGSP